MFDDKSKMPDSWTVDLWFEKSKPQRVDKLDWVKS